MSKRLCLYFGSAIYTKGLPGAAHYVRCSTINCAADSREDANAQITERAVKNKQPDEKLESLLVDKIEDGLIDTVIESRK